MYVPSWFPGTGWKQTAKLWHKTTTDAINVPFEYAKLLNGDVNSFVAKALAQRDEEKGGPNATYIESIRGAAFSLYTGGM